MLGGDIECEECRSRVAGIYSDSQMPQLDRWLEFVSARIVAL